MIRFYFIFFISFTLFFTSCKLFKTYNVNKILSQKRKLWLVCQDTISNTYLYSNKKGYSFNQNYIKEKYCFYCGNFGEYWHFYDKYLITRKGETKFDKTRKDFITQFYFYKRDCIYKIEKLNKEQFLIFYHNNTPIGKYKIIKIFYTDINRNDPVIKMKVIDSVNWNKLKNYTE